MFESGYHKYISKMHQQMRQMQYFIWLSYVYDYHSVIQSNT